MLKVAELRIVVRTRLLDSSVMLFNAGHFYCPLMTAEPTFLGN